MGSRRRRSGRVIRVCCTTCWSTFDRPVRGRRFDRTTAALVNWVPGTMAKRNPPGSATRIPKGSTLLWELHYTPNGRATTDRTSMALTFAEEEPELETRFSIWANWRISIPPEDSHHEERASLTIREDAVLVSLRPHMHVRGKSWRYEVDYPGRAQRDVVERAELGLQLADGVLPRRTPGVAEGGGSSLDLAMGQLRTELAESGSNKAGAVWVADG